MQAFTESRGGDMTDGPLFPLPHGRDPDSTQSSYPQIDSDSHPPMGAPPGQPHAPPNTPTSGGGIPPMVWAGLAAAIAVVIAVAGVAFAMTRSDDE